MIYFFGQTRLEKSAAVAVLPSLQRERCVLVADIGGRRSGGHTEDSCVTLTNVSAGFPALKRLLYPDAKPEGELDFDNHTVLGGDDELSLLAAQAEAEPVFGLRDGQLKLPDLHRDEDLLKAVRALVANEPDLAAQVIKEWVTNRDA